jgi:hypothetical protein
MGTGCLEALLYELFKPRPNSKAVVEQIILVGTAGRLHDSAVLTAEVSSYFIEKAYFGPTALQAFGTGESAVPRFNTAGLRSKAAIISTDTFYLFAKPADIADHSLRQQIEGYWNDSLLIDMEVAQFYYLCSRFAKQFGLSELSYAAIKSPSNDVGNADQQITNSRACLDICVRDALEVLEYRKSVGPLELESTTATNGKSDKLIEEVKLYWTIQLGILAGLGVLVANLKSEVADLPKLFVCFTALGLLLIGTMYNLVGNYYTFMERFSRGTGTLQEDIITIVVGRIYFMISSFAGAAIGYLFSQVLGPKGALDLQASPITNRIGTALGGHIAEYVKGFGAILSNPFEATLIGFALAALMSWLVFRVTIKKLKRLGTIAQRAAYEQYIRKMRLLFFI